jgi:hypothetical protein
MVCTSVSGTVVPAIVATFEVAVTVVIPIVIIPTVIAIIKAIVATISIIATAVVATISIIAAAVITASASTAIVAAVATAVIVCESGRRRQLASVMVEVKRQGNQGQCVKGRQQGIKKIAPRALRIALCFIGFIRHFNFPSQWLCLLIS